MSMQDLQYQQHHSLVFYHIQNKKYLSSMLKTKYNILKFSIDCYNDIMNILSLLHKIQMTHGDPHLCNILVDISTFKCYLIDYGNMFSLNKIYKKGKFKCMPHISSPLAWYYLCTAQKRVFFENDIMYSKQYETASYIFHGFIQMLYANKMIENSTFQHKLLRMNKKILKMETNYHHIKITNDTYIEQWCTRYKIIQLLKADNINLYLNKLKNKSLKNKFWSLA
eukprot:219821_1